MIQCSMIQFKWSNDFPISCTNSFQKIVLTSHEADGVSVGISNNVENILAIGIKKKQRRSPYKDQSSASSPECLICNKPESLWSLGPRNFDEWMCSMDIWQAVAHINSLRITSAINNKTHGLNKHLPCFGQTKTQRNENPQKIKYFN